MSDLLIYVSDKVRSENIFQSVLVLAYVCMYTMCLKSFLQYISQWYATYLGSGYTCTRVPPSVVRHAGVSGIYQAPGARE